MLPSVTFLEKERNLMLIRSDLFLFDHLQLSDVEMPFFYFFHIAFNVEKKSMGTSLLCLEFLDLACSFLQNQACWAKIGCFMRYRYLNTKLASSTHRNINRDGLELAGFSREDKERLSTS